MHNWSFSWGVQAFDSLHVNDEYVAENQKSEG